MDMNSLPIIDPDVDYREVAPIHHKRSLAFINHFIMRTVSFLNTFSRSCESQLMEFEYKLQKVEASLLVLESKLASIPGLDEMSANTETEKVVSINEIEDKSKSEENLLNLPEVTSENNSSSTDIEKKEEDKRVKAKDDPRFSKFFKMLQFGVPEPAVKLKMQAEGIDPEILNDSNAVVPGYEAYQNEPNDSDSSSSS